MTDNGERALDANAALEQARRVEDEVRSQGRWHGWVWLAVGVATPVFLIGTASNSVSREIQFWIAVGFMLLGGWLAIWETRRGVWSRESVRADRPMTTAYVAAMVLVAVLNIVFEPVGPPLWYVVAALLPSVPCLLAAWRILRG